MGMTALRRVQIGKETTMGTLVAATKIMHVNDAWLTDKRSRIAPKQAVGRMIPPTRVYTGSEYSEIVLASDATYEELPYILNAAINGATPSGPGGDGQYTYTYAFPITGQGTLFYYTIEGGDDQQEYEAGGGFVRSFELNWTAPQLPGGDGTWQYTSTWGAQGVAKSTFTGSLNVTTIETITAPKIYLDTTLANIGQTQKTLTLLAASFKWQENLPISTGDGTATYTYTKQSTWDNIPTLSLTFEHDATGEAEYDAWVAGTQAAIRLYSTGSVIGGATTKAFTLDFYGTQSAEPTWGSQQGDDTITVVYENRYYDTTSDLAGQIIIVNALSALP